MNNISVEENIFMILNKFDNGNHKESCNDITDLIKKSPNNLRFLSVAHYIYKSLKMYQDSLNVLNIINSLYPNSPNILFEISRNNFILGDYNKALEFIHKSYEIRSSNFDIIDLYRKILYKISHLSFRSSHLEEAINYLKFLLNFNSRDGKAKITALMCESYIVSAYEWQDLFNINIEDYDLESHDIAKIIIKRSIGFWLNKDYDNLNKHLKEYLKIYNIDENNFKLNKITNLRFKLQGFLDTESLNSITVIHSFFIYLMSLMNYDCQKYRHIKKYNEKKNIIYFISDSHALGYNGQVIRFNKEEFVVKSHFILGGKIWHLSNKEQRVEKKSFLYNISLIPDNAKVIFGFGEIDCRLTEGMFAFAKSSGQNIDHVIKNTIDHYIDFLDDLTQYKNFTTIIYGVPAPHQINADGFILFDEMKKFCDMIEKYNLYLKNKCTEKNWVFLDVYSFTLGKNKKSNAKHHIDGTHLTPDSLRKICILS